MHARREFLRRRSTWWVAIAVGVLLVAVVATLAAIPSIVRRVAIAQVEATTGRRAGIDRVDVRLLQGRVIVHGFRLSDRDGDRPLAELKQLDVRVHLPSLLLGHVWIRDLALDDPTVRVVRRSDGQFSLSDLIDRSGSSEGGARHLTIDRFVMRGGTVEMEDRAVTPPRTWTSRDIAIDARNVSTSRADGIASARAITAGAPTSVDVTELRLYPIHLRATAKVDGLDVSLAQVYLPPGSMVVDRGHTTSTMMVTLDARDGVHAEGTAQLTDLAIRRPDEKAPIAIAPKITVAMKDLVYRDDGIRVAHLALDGALGVRDPVSPQSGRFRRATINGGLGDVTWPITTPGRLDLVGTVEGGGTIEATGLLLPPPDRSQLRVRAGTVDLAPWTQLLPLAARVSGVAEADLRMNEPLGAGIPARVEGSVAVTRLAVFDERQQVLGAQRIEARGLALHWPERIDVDRVIVSSPRGIVERDRDGGFPVMKLLRPRTPADAAPVSPRAAAPDGVASGRPAAADNASSRRPAQTVAPVVGVGEIVVNGGALAWRDATVSPAARFDMDGIDASVKGVGWPLRGPAIVRIAARPPGGGHVRVSGRIGLDPITADVHVVASNAELAPYQAYVPTPARITGATDLDLAVVVPSLAERRATARGTAGLSRLDVRDHERTVARVERATATGVDVQWPERVSVRTLALAQPWMLLERDDKGQLALRSLLPGSSREDAAKRGTQDAVAATPNVAKPGEDAAEPLAISIAEVSVERGGVRVVDRAVAPPFAVDVQGATVSVRGLSTNGTAPARLQLTAQIGAGAELDLRGTMGALGGPLNVDLNGELRQFAVPRTNPYLVEHVGWKTTEGRLTTKLECRIRGDALNARTAITLSRLHLVRASAKDGAEKRMGLPLGMLTSLMKDKHGDIKLAFPVGGRLGDPRFDFSEAIWSAVRTVTVNAITLPVSWIGRVRFSSDSKIEHIDVNPVRFEPGTADLSSAGRTQASRLAAFLDHLPEVRMAVTPVVSSQDVDAMKRARVEAAIEHAIREERLPPDAAAARVFAQRFPGQPPPGSRDAIVEALAAREAVADADVRQLADARLDAVRRTLKEADIDTKRLNVMKPVREEGAASQVALDIVEPEGPQRSKLREAVDRVRGFLGGGNASP